MMTGASPKGRRSAPSKLASLSLATLGRMAELINARGDATIAIAFMDQISPLSRSFVCECHIISTVPRFQSPPRQK
jgi:hypothetical protein